MSQPPSRPTPSRRPTTRSGRKSFSALSGADAPPRRASMSVTGLAGAGPKNQRTSKTSQKLVMLPTAPQTKPLPKSLAQGAVAEEADGEDEIGYETDAGRVKSHKSEGERLSKQQRRKQGFKRITAYCVAEGLKMKLLTGYLKREHNVVPRIFDEAIYVVYHLPLLPGYGPNSSVRSSAPAKTGETLFSRMSEAEERGWEGTYFPPEAPEEPHIDHNGFIPSTSPDQQRDIPRPRGGDGMESEAEPDPGYMTFEEDRQDRQDRQPEKNEGLTPSAEYLQPSLSTQTIPEEIAEVVFFEYGVVVFFGLEEGQERGILDDISNAEIPRRPLPEDNWEIEECHFEHDPYIAHPRIYNDFFTLKSSSHLLKLSISHAFAQSTLLARYETTAQRVLSAPETVAIPRSLARTGALQVKRRDALKITGKLFKLRRDVNLVSNVLDVPELFWSEASLKDLYDAVREYMEIGRRVEALNEKLGTASDLLDAIHDHLNNNAMERITWIIIWLIVVACLVEMGEVMARLIVHATSKSKAHEAIISAIPPLSREDALRALDRMIMQSPQ